MRTKNFYPKSSMQFCKPTLLRFCFAICLLMMAPSTWAQSLSTSIYSSCYNDSTTGRLQGYISTMDTGGTAPFNYKWSNGALTASISSVANGTYTVTITDSKGATATSSVTVYCVTPALADSISFYCSNDSTGGINNYSGYAYTNANGGLAPYTYNWSDGTSNSYDGPLANSSYTVTVTDANGNTVISSLSVNCVTPPLSVSASSSCYQDSANGATGPSGYKGYAYASVSGGYFPYTYLWSDGTANANDGPLSNAVYIVTVTDAKGNAATSSVTVNCNCLPPTVSYTIAPDSNFAHWYNLWTNYSSNTVNAIWYWGDGSSTQGLWASHNYATGNFYTICVITYDSCGDSAKFCMNDSIFKMNSSNTMIHANASKPTGIAEQTAQVANLNLFPNPANSSVTIAYELNHNSAVSLFVYDVLGGKVLTVENQNKQEGSYQTRINTEQLNSGIYLVKLSTDGRVATSRLIITK